MSERRFDLAVVGGGPGGYACALTAARLGLAVALVDADPLGPGGHSVHRGCVAYRFMAESARRHRLSGQMATPVDLADLAQRRVHIAATLAGGLAARMDDLGIERRVGLARFASATDAGLCLEVEAEAGPDLLAARAVVLACGSLPTWPAEIAPDGRRIHDTDTALGLERVPHRLAVLGAGAIGLELAGIWASMGARVSVFDASSRPMPDLDDDMWREAERAFRHRRQDLRLATAVREARWVDEGVRLTVTGPDGDEMLDFDHVVLTCARHPATRGLALDRVGLPVNDDGAIDVDATGATVVPGIWAVGDITGAPMRAHRASRAGTMAARAIAGLPAGPVSAPLPTLLHAGPELGWVGQNEAALRAAGVDYIIGRAPLYASAAAALEEDGYGVVKLLFRRDDERLLGAQVVAPRGGGLMDLAAMAIDAGLDAGRLMRGGYHHPGLSEALGEAASASRGQALYA